MPSSPQLRQMVSSRGEGAAGPTCAPPKRRRPRTSTSSAPTACSSWEGTVSRSPMTCCCRPGNSSGTGSKMTSLTVSSTARLLPTRKSGISTAGTPPTCTGRVGSPPSMPSPSAGRTHPPATPAIRHHQSVSARRSPRSDSQHPAAARRDRWPLGLDRDLYQRRGNRRTCRRQRQQAARHRRISPTRGGKPCSRVHRFRDRRSADRSRMARISHRPSPLGHDGPAG